MVRGARPHRATAGGIARVPGASGIRSERGPVELHPVARHIASRRGRSSQGLVYQQRLGETALINSGLGHRTGAWCQRRRGRWRRPGTRCHRPPEKHSGWSGWALITVAVNRKEDPEQPRGHETGTLPEAGRRRRRGRSCQMATLPPMCCPCAAAVQAERRWRRRRWLSCKMLTMPSRATASQLRTTAARL